jgi:hypothetical protein
MRTAGSNSGLTDLYGDSLSQLPAASMKIRISAESANSRLLFMEMLAAAVHGNSRLLFMEILAAAVHGNSGLLFMEILGCYLLFMEILGCCRFVTPPPSLKLERWSE